MARISPAAQHTRSSEADFGSAQLLIGRGFVHLASILTKMEVSLAESTRAKGSRSGSFTASSRAGFLTGRATALACGPHLHSIAAPLSLPRGLFGLSSGLSLLIHKESSLWL
jgi:hypothetical protein